MSLDQGGNTTRVIILAFSITAIKAESPSAFSRGTDSCLLSGNRSEFGEEFGEGSLEPLTRGAERGSAELTVEASRRSPPAALSS